VIDILQAGGPLGLNVGRRAEEPARLLGRDWCWDGSTRFAAREVVNVRTARRLSRITLEGLQIPVEDMVLMGMTHGQSDVAKRIRNQRLSVVLPELKDQRQGLTSRCSVTM